MYSACISKYLDYEISSIGTIFGLIIFARISSEVYFRGSIKNESLYKKWSFLLRISLVNLTKSAENCGFGHIYGRNP